MQVTANPRTQHDEVHAPTLRVGRYESGFGDLYLLHDTRGLPDIERSAPLEEWQAMVALTARPYKASKELQWALDRKLGVVIDSWYVPLATADPELLIDAEGRASDVLQPAVTLSPRTTEPSVTSSTT